MKLRTTLAGLSAAAIAVSGLMLGGTAAMAAPAPFPGGGYVPVVDITVTDDHADESANYNAWHFSYSHKTGYSQEPNGVLVDAAGDTLIRLGNGNDALTDPDASLISTLSIEGLADSLDVVSSNNAKVSLQIPIFYWDGATRKYTSIRQNADAAPNDPWTISSTVGSITGESSAPLADLLAAMGPKARPIAAGLLVQNPGEPVLVSSFTVGDATTRFYAQAETVMQTGVGGVDGLGGPTFVPDTAIAGASNPIVYRGWHEEVPYNNAALGSFVTVPGTGHMLGLEVTGKSQLVYGYDPDRRPQNALPQILNAPGGFAVIGAPVDSTQVWVQVPMFFYPEGVILEGNAAAPLFTTLRALVVDGVVTVDSEWVSSRAFGSVPADTPMALSEILGAMSSYEILSHGFTVESGEALMGSVSFNGYVSTFYTPAPETPAAPAGPEKIANTGAGDNMAPMVGIAALALMALGGVTLAARRRLQG